jgi:hypothetical protein
MRDDVDPVVADRARRMGAISHGPEQIGDERLERVALQIGFHLLRNEIPRRLGDVVNDRFAGVVAAGRLRRLRIRRAPILSASCIRWVEPVNRRGRGEPRHQRVGANARGAGARSSAG